MSRPTPEQVATVPIFAALDPGLQATLASCFDVEPHPDGKRVVTERESGYVFYVVAKGSLAVTRDGQLVRRLGPGDFFGEIAIIGDGRRSATVTAEGPVVVWAMFGTRFRELQRSHPAGAAQITAAMEARIADDQRQALGG